MMRKNYLLDTNVLLHDPHSLYHFPNQTVIIPIEVLEELDSFKREISELGHNSRTVTAALDQLAKRGQLGPGVSLENGGILRIYVEEVPDTIRKRGLCLRNTVDNRMLNVALYLAANETDAVTTIVSKNINLRIKAEALGITAQDYEDVQPQTLQFHSGYYEMEVAPEVLEKFHQERIYHFAENTFYPNSYVILKDNSGQSPEQLGRITDEAGCTLTPVKNQTEGVLGIRPLNTAQICAMDALLNDDIKLVTLMGKAGTGKTLLAVAAGLFKVLVEDKYIKLLIARPTLPMGRDIGYIPGDVEEKMRPWMQPVYDALDMIRDQDRRNKTRFLPRDILTADEIGIEPLTYIRGRSISRQYFIIDEAQNLTPHEVKTIITRIGYDSKVVLTGDPEQIDNPYMDAYSNGFTYLVERFHPEVISAHITLVKGERSTLAALAANIL